MEYAELEISLGRTPKGAKSSRRLQLRQVEKVTNRPVPELELIRNWRGSLSYLWGWYLKLSPSSPVTYLELEAWSRITRTDLTAFEAEVLMGLDHLNRRIPHG